MIAMRVFSWICVLCVAPCLLVPPAVQRQYVVGWYDANLTLLPPTPSSTATLRDNPGEKTHSLRGVVTLKKFTVTTDTYLKRFYLKVDEIHKLGGDEILSIGHPSSLMEDPEIQEALKSLRECVPTPSLPSLIALIFHIGGARVVCRGVCCFSFLPLHFVCSRVPALLIAHLVAVLKADCGCLSSSLQ